MAHLQRADIIKLAELSALTLSGTEVDSLLGDLQQLISYVDELNTVTLTNHSIHKPNQNIFRDDVSFSQPSEPLLAQAPETFDTYFVVPKIVDSSKDAS